MAMIDVESLLQEVSPDSPCGENLEYDPAFGELDRASQGKPEQHAGDEFIPAEEPNWKTVRDQAKDLFARTKDLRVAVLLTRGLLNTGGLAGFSDGLSVVHGLVERYWDGIHPQLDPDDKDPIMRVNILSSLTDAGTTIQELKRVPLVSSRVLGSFGLRDVELAGGQGSPRAGETAPDVATIDAAFQDCDLDELQTVSGANAQAIEHATAIQSTVGERAGEAQGVDFSRLKAVLEAIQQTLSEQLERRGVGEQSNEVPGAGVPQRAPGQVGTRDDVIRILDQACEYFQRHEPSSPVPLLLKRAKRLVSKDFMDIMRDLAPDGVAQAEQISGTKAEDS